MTNQPTTMSLQDLMDKRMPKRRPLVLPWLLQGQQAMIYAETGVGKTLVSLTIALMVAGGGQALGWESEEPRPVLFVDGEMAEEDLQDRAIMLMSSIAGLDADAAARNLHFMARTAQARDTDFPDINQTKGQKDILAAARRHDAELVLLDNFSVLATVTDENDASAMSPTLGFLMDLKADKRATILVHHTGKQRGTSDKVSNMTYRGSSRLATTFDAIIGLEKITNIMADSAGAAFRTKWDKYRGEPNKGCRPQEMRLVRANDGNMRWETEDSITDEMRELMGELTKDEHSTGREIAKALGWEASKVTRTKQLLIARGVLTAETWGVHIAAGVETQKEARTEMATSDF